MIHVHLWQGLTAKGRETTLVEWSRPMLVRDALPSGWEGHVIRNGEPASLDEVLEDEDHLTLMPRLFDPVNIAIQIVIAYAIGEVVQLILPKPKPAVERGDERSPTHGFSRMSNVRIEGQPIPVAYGEHRTGGTIINEFIEVDNTTGTSTYFVLVMVSVGPVTSIAGQTVDTPALSPLTAEADSLPSSIFLNDNPLANFSGVEAWVRLGSLEQDVIPGFERAKTTVDINVVLTQGEGSVATDSIPLASYDSAAFDSVWDEHAFGYDTTDADVDGLEVILNFPQGLYSVDASGIVQPTRFVVGYRFAKLDGSGNPLLGSGNGGNQDDGWVRLPFEVLTLDRQNPFQLSFPIWFYDPQDFIDPVPGDSYLSVSWTALTSYFRTAGFVFPANRPGDWPNANGVCPELSFECWIAFDASTTSGPFDFTGDDQYVPVFDWTSNSEKDGVWFGFRVTEAGEWFPYMRVGKWKRTEQWTAANIIPTTSSTDKKWHHIVFTHKRLSSSQNENHFYLNGVDYGARTSNIDIVTPDVSNPGSTNAVMYFGVSTMIFTNRVDTRGWWDEVVVWAKTLSFAEVQARYNGASGQRANGQNPDCVLCYHLDGNFVDDSTYSNAGTSVGSGSFQTDEGIVAVVASPERTRGRYRVQVMRINLDENDAGAIQRQDTAEWQGAVTWIDQAFSFPGMAIVGLRVPATDQLNTSAPDTTSVVKGRPVKIWDGLSTTSPSFIEAYSKNPVWLAVDAATNEEYGGGHVFRLENVDVQSAKVAADLCDQRVYDGRGRRDFYRQEWEADANKINSPTEFGSAFWNTGNASVSTNTAESPDGEISADTITDVSGGSLSRFSGTNAITAPSEPGYLCFSVAVKKDVTQTSASPSFEIVVGGTTTACSFTLDTGVAVSNCTVEEHPLDSTWWLVKMSPVWNPGGSSPGSVTISLYPARYLYGTTTGDATLTGDLTLWGAFLNRGSTHLSYPTDDGIPRAYVYLANLDSDGAAQTLPTHWVAGYELRLRSCNDSDWDTPTGSTAAMEIQEIEVLNEKDGYTRVWRITCSWYSTDLATNPGSTFPNLIEDGREPFIDINGNWVESQSGIGMSTEYDDGGTTGGNPATDTPLASEVIRIDVNTLGNIAQTITVTPGVTLKARALINRETGVTNALLAVETANATLSTTDEWEAVESEYVTSTANNDVSIQWIATGTPRVWAGGIGAWVSSDSSGNEPGGSVEGAEALFEYDAIHDSFVDLWDTIVEICLTARVVPVREGNVLRFKADYERSAVGLITGASILADEGGDSTFRVRYSDTRVRPNYLTIDFNDRTQNYDRATALAYDSALDGTSDQNLIRSDDLFLKGVTRRSQAIRHGKWVTNRNRLMKHEGSFRAAPNSISFEPGDVVDLGHDIMPWGQSGRCKWNSGIGVNVLTQGFDSFENWVYTSGNVLITPNEMSTDDGFPVADRIETLIATQVSIEKTVTGITSGPSYAFSIKVKNRSGVKVGISISQSSGQTVVAEYTWSSGAFTELTGTGNNLTTEDSGDGWVRLGAEIVSANTNDFVVKLLPERSPTDLLGTVIYAADAQVERGTDTPTTYDRPGKGIRPSHRVVLENGVSYTARVTNAAGATGTCNVLSPAGEYLEGDLIAIDTATLGFAPQSGDEYLIFSTSERFQAEIVSMGLNEDGSVDVEWVEYNEGFYDGDDLEAEALVSEPNTNNGGRWATKVQSNKIVASVTGMTAKQVVTTSPGGSESVNLDVSWQSGEPGTPISEYRVFYFLEDIETGEFGSARLGAVAPAGTHSALVRMPDSTPSRKVRVAVQAVSTNGARVMPEVAPSTMVVISARAPQPPAPTNFKAHMEGDQIVFSWTKPTKSDGLIYEIRRGGNGDDEGGWVLADVVAETRDDRFGPTDWWATCGTAGGTSVYYHLRSRNNHGVYSDLVSIQYGARVLNAEVLTSSNHWWSYATQAWHSYGDGWVTDSSPPAYDPTLDTTNLQKTTHADGRKYLEFKAGISGTYATASIPSGEAPGFFEREEPLRLEAVVFATAIPPMIIGEGNSNGDGTFKYDAYPPEMQLGYRLGGNKTLEGHLQGDLPTLKIQMRLIRDEGSSVKLSTDKDSGGDQGWQDYRPGIYPCHGAQFRLLVTRPNTNWNVRIWKFWTQTQRNLPGRGYQTPMERVLAQRLGLG